MTVDVNERAQALVEALPYIERFHGLAHAAEPTLAATRPSPERLVPA